MRRERLESTFTAVYRRMGRWYVAYVEELPGANTQGRTLAEARSNLKEAITLILQSNRELAERELRGKRAVREAIRIAA